MKAPHIICMIIMMLHYVCLFKVRPKGKAFVCKPNQNTHACMCVLCYAASSGLHLHASLVRIGTGGGLQEVLLGLLTLGERLKGRCLFLPLHEYASSEICCFNFSQTDDSKARPPQSYIASFSSKTNTVLQRHRHVLSQLGTVNHVTNVAECWRCRHNLSNKVMRFCMAASCLYLLDSDRSN